MKHIYLLSLVAAFLFSNTVQAQKFMKPFEIISKKKPAYITDNEGTEYSGSISDYKRKKGLIKEIELKLDSGKKKAFTLDNIDHAYLPQSGLDKFSQSYSSAFDITEMTDDREELTRLKDGYALFERQELQLKKSKVTVLMQLLNPGASSRIKVYHDPYANETMSAGVGGFKVAGGDAKSYYMSKDEGQANKVQKKEYKEVYAELFSDCEKVKTLMEGKYWSHLEELMFAYNKECKK